MMFDVAAQFAAQVEAPDQNVDTVDVKLFIANDFNGTG